MTLRHTQGDLETMLMSLAAIGRPVLSKMDKGNWHCSFDYPAPEGVTAQCRSRFDHSTPHEALQCCIDRLGGLRSMINVPSPVAGIRHLEVLR